MKRFSLFLSLFLILFPSVVSAQNTANSNGCIIEGTIEEIISTMNAIGQMFADFDNEILMEIDINNCTFDILNNNTGVYNCPINYSANMSVFTDKHLKPTALTIYGRINKNGMPYKTVYDWAYYATGYACLSSEFQTFTDIFIQAIETGHYKDRTIEIVCGYEPDLDDTWSYIIANNGR